MTFPRPPASRRSGFTLVELLVVMGIIALLAVVSIPAFNSLSRGRGLSKTGHDIAGLLEQARTHSMSNNTYTWVGFSAAADGSLLVGVVASKDGDKRPSQSDAAAPGSGILQIGRIAKFENSKLVSLPPDTGRPEAVSLADNTTAIYTFSIGSGGSKRTFDTHVIEFSNQGEAQIIKDTIQRVIEIGIQSAVEGVVRNPGDYVAIQVSGLAGNVTVFRP